MFSQSKEIILLVLLAIPFRLSASKLGKFEKTALKQEEQEKTKDELKSEKKVIVTTNSNSRSPFLETLFLDVLPRAFFYSLAYTGSMSLDRMYLEKENGAKLEKRELGEVMLPIASVETSLQKVEGGIKANHLKLESGYGPIGLSFRRSSYHEGSTKRQLEILQIHGLYRMSFSEKSGASIGFGTMIWNGAEKTRGFSMALPINFHIYRGVSLRYESSWAWLHQRTIDDHKVLLAYSRRYFSALGGYRWFGSQESTLQGPFAGLALHY